MKTIYFVSYGVSGTVWLWNCLIELGIRVDGDPLFTFDFDRTIDATSSRYTRRPGNDHFVTSLPSLAFRSEYVFRSEVFVCMTDHRLRPREGPPGKAILLVRDPRDVLMSFLRATPEALLAVAGGLCARLERSKQLATGIALSGVQERVVSRLVALGHQDGAPQPEGLLIRNRPTQQELANQIGACRETVSRTVSELVRQGLLTPRGRSLLVSKRLVEGSA